MTTRFQTDVKRFHRLALKIGVIAAIVCHLLPPDYKLVCNVLLQICGQGP